MKPTEIVSIVGGAIGAVGGVLGFVTWWQVQRDRRRKAKEEREYQAWVQAKVESLLAGPGNFRAIAPDEHARAARAIREGQLVWGPIGSIPGVMLPETTSDE